MSNARGIIDGDYFDQNEPSIPGAPSAFLT